MNTVLNIASVVVMLWGAIMLFGYEIKEMMKK